MLFNTTPLFDNKTIGELGIKKIHEVSDDLSNETIAGYLEKNLPAILEKRFESDPDRESSLSYPFIS